MSTITYDSLPSYRSLISQPPLCRQKWGDALVIGLKGTFDEITRAYRLFETYDSRPKDPLSDSFPPAPRLSWAWESMAYVYLPSEQRLFDTLSLYFRIMVRFDLGRIKQVESTHESASQVAIPDNLEPHEGESTEEYALRSAAEYERRAVEFANLDVGSTIEEALYEIDEVLAAKLADQATVAFIRDHIETRVFMPDAPLPMAITHSVGRAERQDHSLFERWVDVAQS